MPIFNILTHKDRVIIKNMSQDDDLAYPDGVYQNILYMCGFHPINIFAGFYYGNYVGGTMGIALLATSINYWRRPIVKSYRRIVDMCVAMSVVPYHIYLSFFTSNRLLCSGPLIFGSIMYPFSIWIYNRKYIKSAAYCHCLLHLSIIAGASLTYRDLYFTN